MSIDLRTHLIQKCPRLPIPHYIGLACCLKALNQEHGSLYRLMQISSLAIQQTYPAQNIN